MAATQISTFLQLAAVACGGAIGATLRFVFSVTFPADPGVFAWATFTENVLGSFLLGFAMIALLRHIGSAQLLHLFLCTGALGSFTTFSNYSVEIVQMLHNGRPDIGVVYALASIIAGLLAALLGMVLAGCVTRGRSAEVSS